MSSAAFDPVESGKRTLIRQIELTARIDGVRAGPRPRPIEFQPVHDHRDRVTGRRELQPPAALLEIGRYFRQARFRAGKSQDRLSDESGVSQSMISRFERGLAPAMKVDKLVALARALDRLFPFGTCPHDHDCAWQPILPPKRETAAAEAVIARILSAAAAEEDPSDHPEPATDADDGADLDFFDVSMTALQSPTAHIQSDRDIRSPK